MILTTGPGWVSFAAHVANNSMIKNVTKIRQHRQAMRLSAWCVGSRAAGNVEVLN
jgi:hypothetical protein